MTLRQRHTEGAILYEKKLKPFMKNMNDGKGMKLEAQIALFYKALCHRRAQRTKHDVYLMVKK